jgi:plasmid stabilization system protein ParE
MNEYPLHGPRRADLAEIRRYLINRNPRAAAAVLAAIRGRVAQLVQFPLIGPDTDEPGVRALPVVRYPYRIYYEVAGDEVRILHIRHTRQQPWCPAR